MRRRFAIGAGLAAMSLAAMTACAVVGGVWLAQSRLDPSAWRTRVIERVSQETGRGLRLDRLRVRLLPWPCIEAEGIALADTDPTLPPMLSVGHLRATISLWPLLRHEVRLQTVTLDHLVLHARRDADGRGNWEFASASRGAPGERAPGERTRRAQAASSHWRAKVGLVRVTDAALSWQGVSGRGVSGRGGMHGVLHLASLSGAGLQGMRPHLELSGVTPGASYALECDIGPLARLLAPGDRDTPWHLSAHATERIAGTAVGAADLHGVVRDPLDARGYDLTAAVTMVQAADLNRIFAHAAVPQIQGLEASVHLVDQDGTPQVVGVHARGGGSVLPIGTGGIEDVALRDWNIDAGTADGPLGFAAEGVWRRRAVALQGSVGSWQRLRIDHGVPVPVALTLGIGAARWRIGFNAGWQHISPGNAGRILPGPVYRAEDVRIVSGAMDLAGRISFALAGGLVVNAEMNATRLDLDQTLAALAAPRAAPPAADNAMAGNPAPITTGAGSGAKGIRADGAGSALPWYLLRVWQGDVIFRAESLLAGGIQFHDLVGHGLLDAGKLTIDTTRAVAPGGPISLHGLVDAGAAPPRLEIVMQPVMLPASLLADIAGLPSRLDGLVELAGQVAAKGETRSALLASAAGHVGLSVVDGGIENAALSHALGQAGPLSALVGDRGMTAIRCLGLHATLGDGQMRLDTIGLRTDRISVDGHGVAGLSGGDLDLHLMVEAAIGGGAASVPVRVMGQLSDPRPGLDAAAVGNRFVLTLGSSPDPATECTSLLQSAREGEAGPMLSPVPAAAPRKHKSKKPIDLLRSLGLVH